MPNYDFKSLSPIDFEALVRDVLQSELRIRLETFKSGRDQGIDLRYAKGQTKGLIVQCKHYAESSFSGLFRHLEKDELEKVKALKPDRYILATSLGLTPAQKEKIVGLFHPRILQAADVYGKEDLNNLLGVFPEIEKNHFKLWMSSIAVLEDLLRTRLKNLRRETLDRIQKDAQYYVQNDSFSEALKILDANNFCVIAGIPGIGKTTLAEMLLLHFVTKGYDVVKIESDISEARDVDYVNHRRVFYYDDFLGQASSAEKLNKNEDQSLLDFIDGVRRSKVSKLILTTREYILHQAELVYEKLNRSKFDSETCIIDLSKYTRLMRAQILFNHIFFSALPTSFKTALLKDRSYLKIIDHPNYSPRIIDLMTDVSRMQTNDPSGYVGHFLKNLDNPLEIWRHAFEHQLSSSARSLLLVLTTMPSRVFLDDVHSAFDTHQRQLALHYGQSVLPQDFRRALKELDGNFIATEKVGKDTLILFHNPSVRDFLQNYLIDNRDELLTLVRSAKFYDQLIWLWDYRTEFLREEFKFRPALISDLDLFLQRLERV